VSQASEKIHSTELDVSDVARWIGVPAGGPQPKEPFTVNDIRRFVKAFFNGNPLFYDEEYAAESRFGRIVAPQSYFGGGAMTGAIAANQGYVPNSHTLFGGDEQWFYGPRIYPGDKLRLDRMLFDYRVSPTKFAGPTLFSRGDTTYVNQRGEFIAKQRSTAIRYRADLARQKDSFADSVEPTWSEDELNGFEREKTDWVLEFRELGHRPRLFGSVKKGDILPPRLIGPHSIQSFTSEHRSDQGGWSSYTHSDLPLTSNPGFIPEMQRDWEALKKDPVLSDGLTYGPGKGHVQPRYGKLIGMPRVYGYGASICVWVVDTLTNWAGEYGFLRHHNTRYRNPAFSGDVTRMTCEVVALHPDQPAGFGTVQLRYELVTQNKAQLAFGTAEIELPLTAP
jgi:acyl dehydratase